MESAVPEEPQMGSLCAEGRRRSSGRRWPWLAALLTAASPLCGVLGIAELFLSCSSLARGLEVTGISQEQTQSFGLSLTPLLNANILE